MKLAATEHQEMSGQVKVTCRTLHTIAHSLMVHARVLEAYIHFLLLYKTYHIFPVLPIKDPINEDRYLNITFKPATGKKPSVSHLCVLFCPCVVRKATAHVGTKALNIRHQSPKGFCSIFVEIPQHQKGYLVYVPGTRKIKSSYDVVFDETVSSTLAYKSQTYAEAMTMCPAVSYKLYDTSPKKQTGDIIMFTQFEEGNLLSESQNLLSENCDNTESGSKSDDN